MPWATRSVTTSARQHPSGRRHLGRAGLEGEGVACRRASARSRARSGSGSAGPTGRGARAAARAGPAWRPTAAPTAASGRAPAACRRRRGAASSPPKSSASGDVGAVGVRPADLDEVQPGRQLGRQVDDDGPPVGRRGVDGGRDRRRRVDDHEVALVAATAAGRGRCSGGAARSPIDTSMRTASRRPSVSSGGSVASSSGGRTNESSEIGRRRSCAPPRAAPGSGRSARSPSTRARIAGHAGLGRRAVGDVLAGEGVLVHLGAHVAGVDGQHPQLGVLGGEHPADVVERGLGGAVAAPALVGLDRRVGRDVDDDGAARRGGAAPPGSARAGRRR